MTRLERTGRARGIHLAVLSNRLDAVVRAMRNTLTRTSRSGVINVARDFSCAIVSHNCQVLHWAESLPAHAVSGPDLMARSMLELHPRLRRGDAFLHNSPYHGGGHAADHAIVVPVVDSGGAHHFTVVAKAHQADCGNAVPTTYSANARDVYEEGALIFPCVRVQSDYRDNEDLLRMCRMRIRVPSQWWGDYLALLGAARTGERRMLELGEELGWDVLREFSDEWLDYSEQRMANAIRALPAGQATVTSTHDPVPAAPDGIPVKVKVRVRSEDGMIDIDLRENLDCLPCGMNLTECMTRAAAMIGIFNSVATDIPPNGGSARRINVLLRENCVVGIPRHPASCSVATTNVFDRLANAVQRALAGIGDGMGMAEIGVGLPPAVAVISGQDPNDDDAPFVNQLILAWTGGAGGPHSDGWLTTGGPGDGGALLRDSVEIDEMRHPIIIRAQHIVTDSEGAGRQRGAPGGFVEYGPTDRDLEAIYLSDGTRNPPLGARGGGSGAPARQYRRNLDGSLNELEPIGHVILRPGETIVSYTTGGGGFGPAVARDPSLVLQDVIEGWISPKRAEEVYGVVIRDNEIDTERTLTRRAALAPDSES
jgi:N-methylhydantoinase B